MAFKCPACERPLANRRRAACEFCGEEIPRHMLLTAEQQAEIDQMKRVENQRHRARMRQIPQTGKNVGIIPGEVWSAGLRREDR
jgi:hypothetical protein